MPLQDVLLGEVTALETPDRLARYKASEGTTDRVAIVLLRSGPDHQTHARILRGVVRYHAALGSVLYNAELPEALWADFEEPRERAVTLIAKYPTDSSGKITKERLARETRVMQWEFGTPTLTALKALDENLRATSKTVGMVDLLVRCTSSRYQRVELAAVEPCIWRASPNYAEWLLDRVRALEGQLRLGKELNEAQIRAALGMPSPQPVADSGDDGELDRLLNEV